MKKEKKKIVFGASVIGALLVGVVSALIVMSSIGVTPFEKPRSWHVEAEWTPLRPLWAEGNPGAGAGGILEIYLVNHSSDGNLTENTTGTIEGWCDANNLGYCNADDSDVDLAHSTDFDIGIKVRANRTQAYRTDKFFDSDVRVRITSADLSIAADTVLTGHILDNSSSNDYIWMMFETKAADSNGFSIVKDSTNEITSIKFECYY
jgi:hypothetical protein